jgi:hypothetical protein
MTTSKVDARALEGMGEVATRAYAHLVAEVAIARHAQHAPLWREVRRLAWAVFVLAFLFSAALVVLLYLRLHR